MFDTNLMLLDETAMDIDQSEETGAYIDLWSINADVGPQFDAYEDATPGTGQVVRPLIWTCIWHSFHADVSGASIGMVLQFSEDGTGTEEVEVPFPTLADDNPPGPQVQRMSVLAPYRYVRYSVDGFTSGPTGSECTVSLGPDDGGEYASPGT